LTVDNVKQRKVEEFYIIEWNENEENLFSWRLNDELNDFSFVNLESFILFSSQKKKIIIKLFKIDFSMVRKTSTKNKFTHENFSFLVVNEVKRRVMNC
jgi:hypothetical protein